MTTQEAAANKTAPVAAPQQSQSLTRIIADAMSKLPPGHTRKEGFACIEALGLKTAAGEPISGASYYHHMTKHKVKDGRFLIHTMYPDFKVTEGRKHAPRTAAEQTAPAAGATTVTAEEIKDKVDNAVDELIADKTADVTAQAPAPEVAAAADKGKGKGIGKNKQKAA